MVDTMVQDQLHPGRDEDLVRRAAEPEATRRWSSASATCARRWTRRCASRRIFQAIIAKLWKLRRDNMTFRVYPTALIEENKWRAVRYGLDGKLLDLGKQKEVPVRELIHELIDWFLRDVIDELGTPQGDRVRVQDPGEAGRAPTGS